MNSRQSFGVRVWLYSKQKNLQKFLVFDLQNLVHGYMYVMLRSLAKSCYEFMNIGSSNLFSNIWFLARRYNH